MSRLRSFTLELNPPSDFGPLRSLHEETVKQILNESDRMTRKACLDAKQKMHIVLLTEEMISVMPHLMEYGSGKFWIDSADNVFELHIQVTPKDAAAQRRAKAPGAPRTFMARIIDIFGKDIRFEEETDTYVIVSAQVTENAMIQFAKSYSPDVVILEPQRMVDEMKDWAKKVKKAYGG